MKQIDTNLSQKSLQKFNCNLCDYYTSSNKDFNKHLTTQKHKMKQNETIWEKFSYKYICCCGKEINSRSTHWRHKTKCPKMFKEMDDDDEIKTILQANNDPSDKDLIMMLIKENSEMKSMMMEVIKNGTHNTNTNNSNSHNKTFNLQFFLNEQCKDAININEFINSIQLQVQDLEETGQLGYVDGISKVVIKNLNALNVHNRPIHCSDAKREILYIKDDEQWTKDNDNKDKMKNVIKQVAYKNMKQIPEWVKIHPECFDSDSKQNDKYLKIVSNSMSGSTEEEQKTNINKIISKVAKEVVINK